MGNPKTGDDLERQFSEISLIGLKEGVLPKVLYLLFIKYNQEFKLKYFD